MYALQVGCIGWDQEQTKTKHYRLVLASSSISVGLSLPLLHLGHTYTPNQAHCSDVIAADFNQTNAKRHGTTIHPDSPTFWATVR